MRCRKARSYLSAYCGDELGGNKRLAVSEHLSTCPACRKEAAIYASLYKARGEVESLKVPDDFNTKLLNRISQERFAETRTRAYLPRRAPAVVWSKAVPAIASVCLAVIVTALLLSPGIRRNAGVNGNGTSTLDDAYLTAQPVDNPNMVVSMEQGWSLSEQLARVERVSRISNSLTPDVGFDHQGYVTGLRQVSQEAGYRIPYVPSYYKVRPVVRIYGLPDESSVKEVTKVY